MKPTQLVLAALLLALVAPPAVRADEVDAYIQARLMEQSIPSLSLAVIKDGNVVKAQGYGLANVEHNVPAKPETVYHSASVGKQFTATAVMMLVEEGRLGLDDKISMYLDPIPDAWQDVTVRHLLSHTSGIKTYSYNPQLDLNFRQDYTEAELLQKAASLPPDFAPGAKWSYSNTGYVLLGMIIRKATGEFYGDMLQKRVFTPLGMDTARIVNEADIVPNRAAGYRLVGRELKNQNWVSPSLNTTADGSLYLSVLDMAKWDAALYTEKLLKRSSLEQTWTPVKTADGKTNTYGFGWQLRDANGHKIVEHTGSWQGFSTVITRIPDDKLTVIVLANLAQVNARQLIHDVVGLYLPSVVATGAQRP
jgi:CubicO group peptidase (beta-lactamase class C family)